MSTQDLDQSAIDSLFYAAETEQKITAVNFQNRKTLTPEQMHLLVAANQVFGRSATARMSSWLNVDSKVAMVTAERMLFREYLDSADMNGMYFGEARFATGSPALLSLDLGFVSALVHLTLGGLPETPDVTGRELTVIDSTVMNGFLSTITSELNLIWSICGMQAEYMREVHYANVGKVLAQTEYLLVFTYELKMGAMEGMLQVALSTIGADTLLRELDRRDIGRSQAPETLRLLQNRMANARHRAHLRSPQFHLTVAQILDLAPGTLLTCGIPQTSTAEFGILGGKVWTARPAMQDNRIVAQIDGSTVVRRGGLEDMDVD